MNEYQPRQVGRHAAVHAVHAPTRRSRAKLCGRHHAGPNHLTLAQSNSCSEGAPTVRQVLLFPISLLPHSSLAFTYVVSHSPFSLTHLFSRLLQLSTFALTLFRHVGVVDGEEYKVRPRRRRCAPLLPAWVCAECHSGWAHLSTPRLPTAPAYADRFLGHGWSGALQLHASCLLSHGARVHHVLRRHAQADVQESPGLVQRTARLSSWHSGDSHFATATSTSCCVASSSIQHVSSMRGHRTHS